MPESFHYLVSQSDIQGVEKWIVRANQYNLKNGPKAKIDTVKFCKEVAKHSLKKEVLLPENGYFFRI